MRNVIGYLFAALFAILGICSFLAFAHFYHDQGFWGLWVMAAFSFVASGRIIYETEKGVF